MLGRVSERKEHIDRCGITSKQARSFPKLRATEQTKTIKGPLHDSGSKERLFECHRTAITSSLALVRLQRVEAQSSTS